MAAGRGTPSLAANSATATSNTSRWAVPCSSAPKRMGGSAVSRSATRLLALLISSCHHSPALRAIMITRRSGPMASAGHIVQEPEYACPTCPLRQPAELQAAHHAGPRRRLPALGLAAPTAPASRRPPYRGPAEWPIVSCLRRLLRLPAGSRRVPAHGTSRAVHLSPAAARTARSGFVGAIARQVGSRWRRPRHDYRPGPRWPAGTGVVPSMGRGIVRSSRSAGVAVAGS